MTANHSEKHRLPPRNTFPAARAQSSALLQETRCSADTSAQKSLLGVKTGKGCEETQKSSRNTVVAVGNKHQPPSHLARRFSMGGSRPKSGSHLKKNNNNLWNRFGSWLCDKEKKGRSWDSTSWVPRNTFTCSASLSCAQNSLDLGEVDQSAKLLNEKLFGVIFDPVAKHCAT